MKSKLLSQFNGANVVGITKASEIKDISHVDSRFLHTMDFTDSQKSLGMLELFENAQIVKVPFLKDIVKNSDYIYVNGVQGSFTYEIPMDLEYCKVIQTIDEGDYLGIDGSPFNIKTSHPFAPNDRITYDLYDGVQMIVSPDVEVEDEGDGFVHEVTLAVKGREVYLEASKLAAGTELMKVGHTLGEYDTQFSNITGSGTPQSVKLEYSLGVRQGVEVAYTDYANTMKLNGKADIYNHLVNTATSMVQGMDGGGIKDKYLFVGQINSSKEINKKTMKVEKLMHALAMAELYKMLGTSMMFSQATTVTGINGSKKVNEGIYPQLRRGKRYTYRNVNELRNRIETAAAAIFSGINIGMELRELVFKAGFNAYNLVREMFKNEFANTLAIPLDHAALGGLDLLSGKDRYNQKYESFAIGKAFLNGIGNVEIIHDASMDYDFGDMVLRGYNADLSKRSFSLVMWDVTDPMYTNVTSKSALPKGVTVHQKAENKNLYIVKAEDTPDVSFGTQTGRMSGQGVKSSMRHMGEEFWCFGQMDAWIPDLGKVVLIERSDALTEEVIRRA